MKAVAVLPGKPHSVHQREIPRPGLGDQPQPHVCRVPEGRAVLVKTLQVGVDATRPAATTWSSATRASARSWKWATP